jgi:diguanylate cyclase (GGDEF)-like protein
MTVFLRRAVGPLSTLGAAWLFLAVPAIREAPPAPGALLLACVIVSTALGGTTSGLLSAAIGFVSAAYAFSEPGTFLVMPAERAFRLFLLIGFGFGIPLLVAAIRTRAARLLAREREARASVEAAHRELMTLHAALDRVDHGVLLLDDSLRVDFMNAAFRRLWALGPIDTELRPTFAELVQRAANKGVHRIGMQDDENYVAQRVALVRQGSEEPIDLRLVNGEIVRFQCKTLANGGRLLTYTDVTDLVHQSEQFERLATTDDLTGVFNRRYFLAQAERAFTACLADRRPVALLILDIDLFKSINDCFGHGVGDGVICHVADVCRAAQRTGDILARIGGEEFTLLLPNTDLAAAGMFAEEIRSRFAAAPVAVEGHNLRVTVSIGVAAADAATVSLGDLMRRADQALYGAKRGGRNRVQHSPGEAGKRIPSAPSVAA